MCDTVRREGQVRVTTTGDLRFGSAPTGPDDARRAGVSELRSALAALAGPGELAEAASRPECRATRAALYDYLHGRLVPSRRHRVEVHLDGCPECTRAFIDVREVSWALRGLGRRLAAADHRGGRHRARRSPAAVGATAART